MKILIFSWRDIRHPGSGGAEIVTIELAKRWVARGHRVFLISAHFPGGKFQETIGGVRIFRCGQFYRYTPREYISYLIQTINLYKKRMQGVADLIIDQVHGLPFFTPFYAQEKVILSPHEVAGKIWFREIPFPFSLLGFLAEIAYIKMFRKIPFYTVSSSTAKELTRLGAKKVFTVYSGINLTPLKKIPKKSPLPLLVSLGRITPMKRIEHTLQAFRLLHKDFPKIKLVVMGRGKEEYLTKLKELCYQMAIEDRVCFPGFVSETEKRKQLSGAWALVSSSLKEGWGLTIIEAAACGTTTVGYRVPGLIDSVKHQKTGLLCQKETLVELARNIRKVLLDSSLRKELSRNALEYSRQFSWDKAAGQTLKIFQEILKTEI